MDETRVFKVVPPVDGLVRQVASVATGDGVHKDELLATFLNREVLRPQQAYLQALNSVAKYSKGIGVEQPESKESPVQAAEENLEYLGISRAQIREIADTRKATPEVEIRSPASGLLLVRNAFPGTRFDRGTELFEIGDVTHVWVYAENFENESRLIRLAKTATVSYQGRQFPAMVSKAPPQFDPASRTLKTRLDLDNPDLLLRPGMFVDVRFELSLPPAITVPDDAVVDSGQEQIVYIARGNGYFVPRRVVTGWRLDGCVQIVKGLTEGEKVVVSGTFLVDSESRLRGASSAFQGNAPTPAGE